MYKKIKKEKIEMVKLTKQKLPPRGTPFYYCEKCNHYVPFKDKHNRKRHKNDKNKR